MTIKITRLKVLFAGISSLVLMVGIARFSYTPLLVIMQDQANLGIAESGWLATINYLGYFTGAIIASQIKDLRLKDALFRLGLVMAVVTTAGMGLTDDLWLWIFLRFIAGLCSAAGLLLGSGLVLHWLLRHNFKPELGIHFIGMGLGIAVCALFVELLRQYVSWNHQWLLLSVLGLLILIPAWRWLPRPESSVITNNGTRLVDNPPSKLYLRVFMAAYFCAGVGYVVGITFIVAFVDQLPGFNGQGSWAYFVLGIFAAPACIIWDFIARKTGDINALIAAFLLQVVGILLPLIGGNLFMVFSGAALFGFSFIGIVSLVLTMAGRFYPTRPATMMGKMTITYGIAQILAPAITGVLAEYWGNYNMGFYIAAVVMLFGSGFMVLLGMIEKQQLKV